MFKKAVKSAIATTIDYMTDLKAVETLLKRRFGALPQITLDNFADLFIALQGAAREDTRKMFLSIKLGVDVYAINIRPTFHETITANAGRFQIIEI